MLPNRYMNHGYYHALTITCNNNIIHRAKVHINIIAGALTIMGLSPRGISNLPLGNVQLYVCPLTTA